MTTDNKATPAAKPQGPAGALGRICAALGVTDGAAALAEVARLKEKQAELLALEGQVAGLKRSKEVLDCREVLRGALREGRLDRAEADKILGEIDRGDGPEFTRSLDGLRQFIAAHPPRLGSRGE